jgi:hypothetical protein
MSHFQASIIADSISPEGIRLTTMELVYPRFIHAEAKTHRQIRIDSPNVDGMEVLEEVGFMDDPNLSRNASSSRAIPTAKLIEMVRSAPVTPIHWGKNQPGMQAAEELQGFQRKEVVGLWRFAAEQAAWTAGEMAKAGAHKQVVNRILEPFLPIRVVATATEWANFFALRRHADAQPEIKHLADLMWAALQASVPVPLEPGEWHLPYVLDEEIALYGGRTDPSGTLRKISAARDARVSYRTHDGLLPRLEEDLALYERLVGSAPIHASPTEHQATPDTPRRSKTTDERGRPYDLGGWDNPHLHGNLRGWIQHRKMLLNECIH